MPAPNLPSYSLERFHGGPKLSELPSDRVADIKAFYPSARDALPDGDRLLIATGSLGQLRNAVRRSPVGKTSPTALYVRVNAEPYLPTLLRLYVACGEMLTGRPPGTTLLKLHHDRAAISFLHYPDFNRDPHPRISASLTAHLPLLKARWLDYEGQDNRPLLHRKEEFLHPSDARYPLYANLTRSEIRVGLYAEPERIARELGWEAVLAEHGKTLRGHRLVAATVGPQRIDP